MAADEEQLLRSVALQNAQAIQLARQQVDEALHQANQALERKTAELAQSLSMLRATLESTTDGILVTESSGAITGFNEKFLAMWNVSRELVSGGTHQPLLDVAAEKFADPGSFLDRVRTIYATSPPESYDLLEREDGRVFERFSRIQVVDGRNVGRVWSFREITDERRAQEALAHESERFRTTLSSIGDGVISTDPDGRVTFLNRVAETLTGWTLQDAIGQSLHDVFHIVNHNTRAAVENPALRALREGRIVGLANHTVLIARDGTERPIDDSAAPIRDASGEVMGAVLVFRDVSDRMQALEVQARLAAIVESSHDVIVSKSLDGTIQSWNSEAERLFGYTAAEAVGQSIGLIIPSDRADEERSIMERLRRGERVEPFDTVRVGKGGRLVEISVTISPIRDGSGRVVGASKVARDVADRKRIEEELRIAARRKDEFLAILAHELRNPLAPLASGLHVMRLASGDLAACARARTMMERQLAHMVRLVDDLLDASRISRNKMELRRSRLLVADVVSSAIETARPLIDAAAHELTVTVPDEAVYVDGDLTRLSQVLANLLTNSAESTNPGGRIFLEARRDRDHVVIAVRDTGIGIPADHVGKVFGMFSQVGRSIERSSGGLGIGLALVDGLVKMHGGTVTAESAGTGKGSTFTVTLPVLQPEVVTFAPQPSVAALSRPSTHRILVVDDNLDSTTSMAMMLECLGNEVRVAHDGIGAVAEAERFQPDVVLMDVGMPRLNGYDATRRIRAQPWGQKVVIIALTGWGQDEDKVRSHEAGCDAHMTKPVSLPDLESLLVSLKPSQSVQSESRSS